MRQKINAPFSRQNQGVFVFEKHAGSFEFAGLFFHNRQPDQLSLPAATAWQARFVKNWFDMLCTRTWEAAFPFTLALSLFTKSSTCCRLLEKWFFLVVLLFQRQSKSSSCLRNGNRKCGLQPCRGRDGGRHGPGVVRPPPPPIPRPLASESPHPHPLASRRHRSRPPGAGSGPRDLAKA